MKKKKCHICGKEITSSQNRTMVVVDNNVKTVHKLCRDYQLIQRGKP
jgi:hypothetical protein